ncbi:redox-active disulfide protein 2 [Flavobacterium tructae]|uniref:Redox-active disulfide protein 2 n=1 Tax=Flavobacterium tructae TaxID=1114873 RepID=A0A1S1JG55_9FLAO|nr:redox-active disulfide protein 2 [Flavobacterium tructae]OHT47233.1 redox-active disulfide protein 2 [Flavobacterium tructae]OXB19897.1 redox-active disulfide protein 2 [Flavobacterium tructae]
MSIKKYSEMTTEELVKSEKISKSAAYAFTILLLLLFISNIYLAFLKGFSAVQIVPIALLPLLIFSFKTLKDIQTELKSREK